MSEYDGQPPVRVSFGPKEWQACQPEVASMLLTMFCEREPETFGAYYAEVLTGVKPKVPRGK